MIKNLTKKMKYSQKLEQMEEGKALKGKGIWNTKEDQLPETDQTQKSQ